MNTKLESSVLMSKRGKSTSSPLFGPVNMLTRMTLRLLDIPKYCNLVPLHKPS